MEGFSYSESYIDKNNERLGSAWGHRTASEEETELFYGYKFHAAVLLTGLGPLPLAGRLAPASVADVELAPVLIDEACRQHQLIYGFRPEYYRLRLRRYLQESHQFERAECATLFIPVCGAF